MAFLTANSLARLVDSAVSTRSAELGRVVHAQIIKTLEPHIPAFLSNHLVNMYAKLNLPGSARLVLSLTSARSVVTWTSLIAGNVQNGHFAAALLDFASMRRENIAPNDYTLPCAFKASATLDSLAAGRQIHAVAFKVGESEDIFVGSSALDMYGKTGVWEDVQKMFDEMPHRNSITVNAFISNAVLSGRPGPAIRAFLDLIYDPALDLDPIGVCAFLNACADSSELSLGRQCHCHVIIRPPGLGRHVKVLNGLVDFYGKLGCVRPAEIAFKLTEGTTRSQVSWCSMAAAYVSNGEHENALRVFLGSMGPSDPGRPDGFMLSTALAACGAVSGLELGRAVHGLAVRVGSPARNLFVGTALVDMYGKCGSLEDAERAFNEMPSKNSVAMNAMISAYSNLGLVGPAIKMFDEMTETRSTIKPNYVTFVSLLSACSRAGQVETGMSIFESMRPGHGIEPGPEHYACVVDMLGRAGMVERAHKFIEEMPIQGTISIWGALLGACRMHRKTELGRIAADKLFRLDPDDSGNHVLLSNMLASSGRWEEANVVRKEMKETGIKKGAGFSWITVKDTVHTFVAKDSSHERNSEIQSMLTNLRTLMKESGYVPDTDFSLFDLEEEEKASEVWSHSEKIALAFALVAVPPGGPIRITKNLRICGDCHSAFKFVSSIFEREIIVRDNHRFHLFKNGVCSCNDYW